MKDFEVALFMFELHKKGNTKDVGYYAIEAIKMLVQNNKTIPSELTPYLMEACEAWSDIKGVKVKSYTTKMKWRQRVFDVELLRQSKYKRDAAIAAIAERDDIKPGSLLRKYKDSIYADTKESAQRCYEACAWGSTNPDQYYEFRDDKFILKKKVQ